MSSQKVTLDTLLGEYVKGVVGDGSNGKNVAEVMRKRLELNNLGILQQEALRTKELIESIRDHPEQFPYKAYHLTQRQVDWLNKEGFTIHRKNESSPFEEASYAFLITY